MKPGKKGFPRLIDAFKYSWHGFKAAFKTEESFRIEVYLSLVLIPLVIIMDRTNIEKLFLLSGVFLILLMEIVNSAIEYTIDRISDEPHQLSKSAKDMGSLLVLLAFVYSITVWLVILVF